MAKRKPGRPKNLVPSIVIAVRLPKPAADRAAAVARERGMARATWAQYALLQALEPQDAARRRYAL